MGISIYNVGSDSGSSGGGGVIVTPDENAAATAPDAVDIATYSPIIWYDASDASTITEAAGRVSQWNDKSGNNYHMTQATGTNQPYTGSRTFNGKNVLDFQGGQFMQSGTFSETMSRPYTMFIVCKPDNAPDFAYKFLFSGLTSSTRSALAVGSSGNWLAFSGSLDDNSVVADNLTRIHEVQFNGSSTKHYIDGVLVQTVNAGTETLTGLSIGSDHSGSGQFDGAICEMVLFNEVKADSIRQEINDQLSVKWYDYVDSVFILGQSNADGSAFNTLTTDATTVGDPALSASTATFYDTKQTDLFIYQKPTERVNGGNNAESANYTDDGEWWTLSDVYDATEKTTHQTVGNGTDVVWTPQRHGVELELAKLYAGYNADKELRIFKCGIGGSGIQDDWAVDTASSTKLYRYFKDYIWTPAINDMLAEGKKPNIRGVFWMQGEEDADNSGDHNSYATYLQTLSNRLDTEFTYKPLNTIVGGLSATYDSRNNGATIKTAQQTVATNNTNVTLLPTDGTGASDAYALQSDNVHYTAGGFADMAVDLYPLIFSEWK